MSEGPTNDQRAYERLLVAEDGRDRRFGLALLPVTTIGLALWFDAWGAFWGIMAFVPFLILGSLWNGFRLMRTGYVTRGKAMLLSTWEWVACAGLTWLLIALQSRFGLWFSQNGLF